MSIVIVLCVFRIYPFGFSLPTRPIPAPLPHLLCFFALGQWSRERGASYSAAQPSPPPFGGNRKTPSQCPRSNSIACSYCSAIALVESEVHAEKVSNKKGQDAALACSPRTHTHTQKKGCNLPEKLRLRKRPRTNPYQAGAPLSRSRIWVADHKRPPGTFARGIGL